MKVLVFFFSYLALVWGQTTIVSPCVTHGSAADLPINTYVVGCDGPSCAFPQLETVELQIVMQSPRQIRSMTTRAFAFLFGPYGVPYDLEEEAVTCNFFTNTYCPLQKDEVALYTLRMRIEPFMPVGTRVTIEFVITDDADDSTVTCLRVPVSITRPIQALNAENKVKWACDVPLALVMEKIAQNGTEIYHPLTLPDVPIQHKPRFPMELFNQMVTEFISCPKASAMAHRLDS